MKTKGTFIITEDKITFQSADYIEHGWYVEQIGAEITLYEIPYGGGEPIQIGIFTDVISAIKTGIELT